MNSKNKNRITDNIKRILMFKSIGKIHEIIEKEKQQKKSDKMHVFIIVLAATLAFLMTLVIFSILEI